MKLRTHFYATFSKRNAYRLTAQTLAGFLLVSMIFEPVVFAYAQESTDSPTDSSSVSTQPVETQTSLDTSVPDPILDTPNFATSEIPTVETPKTSDTAESSTPAESEPVSADATAKTDETSQMQTMSSGGGTTEPSVLNPTFTYQTIAPKVDKTTGALLETLALSVPPGRNGMQPNLALVYNSQRLEESTVGYGWEVNIPYIERINRRGTNAMYSDDYFSSSLSGELASTTVSGEYRARVEESDSLVYSVTATSTSGSWTAYDKKGTRYLFGSTASSRQDDSNNTAHISKWMLDEMRDTNGNYVRYEYSKDNGQIYPSEIYYTGYGGSDGIFSVEFSKESRPDAVTSYASSFLIKTNYRINQIQAKVNGVWVRKYDLAYTTGSNGSRSLLSSVTETGQDESGTNTVSLPATTFEYGNDTVSFSNSGNMNQVDSAARALADVDGNGLLDENVSYINPNNGDYHNAIQLNFNGVSENVDAYAPPYFQEVWGSVGQNRIIPWETGTRLVDVNGDGKADVISGQNPYIYWNDSTNTNGITLHWTQATSTSLPGFGYTINGTAYTLGLFANLNGDGLIDAEKANYIDNGQNGAHFGNGSGFDSNTAYFSPIALLPSYNGGYENDVRLVDINGDGLDDFVYNSDGVMKVCFNTGLAWETGCNSGYNVSVTTVDSYGNDKGVRFLDINGDGLPDYVRSYYVPSYTNSTGYPPDPGDFNLVKLNTGSGWATSTIDISNAFYSGDHYIVVGQVDQGWFVGLSSNELWDWSGDGLTDGYQKLNSAKKPDMLKKITYATGGNTQVEYTPTTGQLSFYWNANRPKHKDLPMTVYTVSSITNNDGNGNSESVSYNYENGFLYFKDPYNRKFAGFESITETKTDSIVRTYYSNANIASTTAGEFSDNYAKIGKPYREEIWSPSTGAVFKRNFYDWETANQGENRDFVFLASTTEQTFDGGANHKDKSSTYTYDSNGNMIQRIDWGEVTASDNGIFTDTGTDLASTTISYIASTTANMFLPYNEITQDQSSNKVKETRYYYDNLSLGNVTAGNLTKREDWKDGGNYVNIQKTYNIYGLTTRDIDPRGKNTDYVYDSYNLYVATSTNALSQTVGSQYDYSSGKVKQVTNQNNRVFVYVLDPLDRLVEEKQPDISTPGTLVTKNTYAYTTGSVPQSILKTSYLNSATTTALYTYFDGIGRKIQERKSAEGTNTYAVNDAVYNYTGHLIKESLPYFASSTPWSSPTTDSSLLTIYSYDPLGRVTTSETAVGTVTNSYDRWETTITDQLGKQKDFYKDAFGNLTSVVEHINGTSATTNYEYNRNNNLTKITDALGNIRNFTYDGLGRRITAEDLHASGDGTFGTYSYQYDEAGNLTEQVDPKSQTVNFTYDDLNRILTENYTGQAGTEVSYGYDSCIDGIGRLCSATTTDTVSNYTYNPLGLPKTESKTISDKTFTTSYDYDRQGNTISIISPDSSKTEYIFNIAGLPESVYLTSGTTTPVTSRIANFDYSPLGQPTTVISGSGATTTNTYDSAHLYRLSNKKTLSALGTVLQDLTYSYDAVGNITSINDASQTNTKKSVGYGYDDLYRLTSVTATSTMSGGDYAQTFTYDLLGNITDKTSGAVTFYAYAGTNYANPDAPTGIGNGLATTTLAYDQNGNLLTFGTTTYAYDYRNRLTSAGNGIATSTYIYDQNGQRVKVADGSTGLTTLYPTKYHNAEYDGGSNIKKQTSHSFAGDILLTTLETKTLDFANYGTCTIPSSGDFTLTSSCSIIGTVLMPASVIVPASKILTVNATSTLLVDFKHYKLLVRYGGGTLIKKGGTIRQFKTSDTGPQLYYHLVDHLGSVAVSTNAQGAVTELSDYYPYGSVRLDTKTGLTEQRKYIGQEFDVSSNLSYLNARYYDGNRGQFLNQDPIFWSGQQNLTDPQSLNSYSYAGNNPLTNRDPSGKSIWMAIPLAGFAAYNISFLGQMAQYYGSNLYNGNYKNLIVSPSTVSQWTMNSVEDASITMTGAAALVTGAEMGVSALVTQGFGFASTFGASIISDVFQGKPTDFSKATQRGIGTVVGANVVGNPSGRYPELFSPNFFGGVHSAYTALSDLLGRAYEQLSSMASSLTKSSNNGNPSSGTSNGTFTVDGKTYAKPFCGVTTNGSYAERN